ncbi:hypothetical protein M3P36_00915 [Altererythrobacter sp. KTW20L]|uniref:hypothetical protein n=1 Tax=Altererythrobacter sp. KTW20L TaxID=2942210 RepID=UPI0020BDF6A3|nr:hypothetical protein [Altererythrobacter sp. KTW20L]MCL6249611.1 hypothetical protein [Altererythrobacter sp. KTW20L]
MTRSILSLSALSALLLAGCATGGSAPMTAGERISERGAAIADYGDAWSSGQDSVNRGTRMVEQGNRQAEQARSRIAKARTDLTREETRLREADASRIAGERLIADGTAQMRRAEEDYSSIRSGPAATRN